MSRTLKDRPYWVRVNDPRSSRYASHDHRVTCREQIGEEPVYRERPDKDGYHWHKELSYLRPLYRLWSETIPCTLDEPEKPPTTWRWHGPRTMTDEQFNERVRSRKNCNYHLTFDGDYRSGKDFKRLTHGAERSKIRQQLQTAMTTHNCWWADWEDVDIHNDSKYASRGWWDY